MKIILTIFGALSLMLGVIGIFVPLLPTTPFLLLSATLFLHSSPKLYEWLVRNPTLGGYIKNYRENRAMPLRAKCTSLTILWFSIIYSILRAVDSIWIAALLVLIAVAVTWHILSLNTTPRSKKE